MREDKIREEGEFHIEEGSSIVMKNSTRGRLLRFLFNPPKLLTKAIVKCDLAERLSQDRLACRIGMERSNRYFDMGCPLDLCDHAAAQDIGRVLK